MRGLSVILLLVATGTATADPAPPPNDDDGPKSPTVATALAAGTTVAGYAAVALSLGVMNPRSGATRGVFALGFTAALAGPSVGQLYAGDWHSGTPGMYLRAASLGVVAVGFVFVGPAACEDTCTETPTAARWVYGSALGLLAAGTIWDIAIAGRFARRANRNHRAEATLALVPTPAGVAVAGEF